MLHDDELNMIGIIPESDLSGTTNETELKRILYDGLSIGPMFQSLMDDLRNKGLIDERTGDVFLQDVCKALYSNSFLKACPMVSISIKYSSWIVLFITIFYFIVRLAPWDNRKHQADHSGPHNHKKKPAYDWVNPSWTQRICARMPRDKARLFIYDWW